MTCASLAASGLQAPVASGAGCRRRSRRPFAAVAATSAGGQGPAAAAPQPAAAAVVDTSFLQRRQLLSVSLLAPAAAALLAAAPRPALAAEGAALQAIAPAASTSSTYFDDEDKFSITVPAGWAQGSGAIGQAGTLTTSQARFSNAAGLRRVVAFFPEGKPEVSVAITVQFVSADYTGLGSFGNAQQFAQGVVNQMDTSYLLKVPEWRRSKEAPIQVARLVDVKEANKQFVFSYTLDKEGEPQRTVFQSVSMGNNGRYNRLYTVNAACTAADAQQYAPVLKQVVDSFRPPAPAA